MEMHNGFQKFAAAIAIGSALMGSPMQAGEIKDAESNNDKAAMEQKVDDTFAKSSKEDNHQVITMERYKEIKETNGVKLNVAGSKITAEEAGKALKVIKDVNEAANGAIKLDNKDGDHSSIQGQVALSNKYVNGVSDNGSKRSYFSGTVEYNKETGLKNSINLHGDTNEMPKNLHGDIRSQKDYKYHEEDNGKIGVYEKNVKFEENLDYLVTNIPTTTYQAEKTVKIDKETGKILEYEESVNDSTVDGIIEGASALGKEAGGYLRIGVEAPVNFIKNVF